LLDHLLVFAVGLASASLEFDFDLSCRVGVEGPIDVGFFVVDAEEAFLKLLQERSAGRGGRHKFVVGPLEAELF